MLNDSLKYVRYVLIWISRELKITHSIHSNFEAPTCGCCKGAGRICLSERTIVTAALVLRKGDGRGGELYVDVGVVS